MASRAAVRTFGLEVNERELRELRKALRDVGEGVWGETGSEALKGLNHELGQTIMAAAIARTPRRTGRLVGTYRAGRQARGPVVTVGGARAPYAGPIHFGWARRGIDPNPFLWDAADDRRDSLVASYQAGLQRIIDSTGL